ncbi:MAG: hypothetical protein WCR42_15900 [bacterium]
MRKLICVLVFILGFCSLTAGEQTIIIKTSGGVEKQTLGADGKPSGETYIGYNTIGTEYDSLANKVKIECAEEGLMDLKRSAEIPEIKCEFTPLVTIINIAIKLGINKGSITDVIVINKKSYNRTALWTSTGYLKDTEITIKLEDAK